MTKPLIIFRNLPGVARLESEQMIADKFHERVAQARVDDISRAIFGITSAEVEFDAPEWFAEGFDSVEDWNDWKASRQDNGDEDMESPEYDYEDSESETESPQRLAIIQEIDEYYSRLCVEVVLKDDYDCMSFARSFGFDFSDSSGQHPLRVTRLFFFQALVASRGVKGHLPDLGELGTKEWGEKLEEEARRFRRSK